MKPSEDIGMKVRRLDNTLRRLAESSPVIKQVPNMTMVNGWLVVLLDQLEREGKTVCQHNLEDELGITRSAISRNLKLMEQKDLITQKPVEGDARLKRLELTDKARGLAKELEDEGKATEKMLLKGFTKEEKETLSGYIDRMMSNLEAAAAELNEQGGDVK